MKKFIFCLSALLLGAASIFAQPNHIDKSEPFDEPGYGWSKLLQMKNGNTFFFHAARKEGIEVELYGKDHKLAATQTIEGQIWDARKLGVTMILGLYEINGEPVLFMLQSEGRQPTLYRLRINPTNGTLIKEEAIGTLPKVSAFAGYAMAFGNAEPSDVIIEKDPNTDCYAVIFFNGFAHDRDERIKVCHYDGTHKKINEAFYESPNGAYKYLRYIGAVVDGDKRVFVATYASKGNFGNDGGSEAKRVIMSRLDAGQASFKHNLLDFSEDFKDTKSVMVYNHSSNQIALMTLSYIKTKSRFMSSVTKSSYLTLLSFIDPESLNITRVKPVEVEKVVAYAHDHIDKDYDFQGLPQQMVLNKDNTVTVLSEETLLETTYDSKTGRIVRQNTYLGPIGVSELSDTGAEMTGYTINKKQRAEGAIPQLYLSHRSKGRFFPSPNHVFHRGDINQFMSFDYINSPKGRYIVLNDIPRNVDRDEDEKKRKVMTTVSNSNTIIYKLNNNSVDKSYLFGEPEAKESCFSYIECSDYNKETSTYATLIVERDGRDKQVRVAWVNFQ